MKKLKFMIASMMGIVSLLSCSPLNHYSYVEGKVNIVATTTMLGDLSRVIGGEHVSVVTLMGAGVDPHSYNPKPSDTRALAKADLVVLNGLHLEAKMGDVLQSIDQSQRFTASDTLEAMSSIRIIQNDEGLVDPHIWGDITNWMVVALSLKDKLVAIDSENAEDYENNYLDYQQQLSDLYQYVLTRLEDLPTQKRVLITAHDAFAYLGLSFGFEVHAIQGISTQSEASVKDIQDLANLVVDLGVKAIFVETSVPENTIQSVVQAVEARGKDLAIGGHLYSDSLGDSESGHDTYLTMYQHNIDTIVDALQ